MPIKQKIPIRSQRIPDQFAEFMRHVAELLEQGDSAAWTESDDLLQGEKAYGGLYDVPNGRYGFSCFMDDAEEENFQICWYFDLDRQQIQDIANGKVRHLDMWRCEGHDCGRRFPSIDYYCPECDFPP